MAGPERKRREGDAILLMRLLHAGGLQVLQDHFGEICCLAVAELLVGKPLEELVVLVHRQHPMRGQALHREGAGDADARVVGIGLVVEIFVVRLAGDGGVDLPLPGDVRPSHHSACAAVGVGQTSCLMTTRAGFPIPPMPRRGRR